MLRMNKNLVLVVHYPLSTFVVLLEWFIAHKIESEILTELGACGKKGVRIHL